MTTYSDLISMVTGHLAREDLDAEVPSWIRLAENRLNRELVNEDVDTIITGTVGSAAIDVSSLNVVDPVALWLQETGVPEREILKGRDFEVITDHGQPTQWELVGEEIQFDRPLDIAYSFRFRSKQKLAYSGNNSLTNWLLTEHPDVYLSAVLLWAGAYIRDAAVIQAHAGLLADGLASVRSANARKKRAVSRVDAALHGLTRSQPGFGGW